MARDTPKIHVALKNLEIGGADAGEADADDGRLIGSRFGRPPVAPTIFDPDPRSSMSAVSDRINCGSAHGRPNREPALRFDAQLFSSRAHFVFG
jgi:hypothetical protein